MEPSSMITTATVPALAPLFDGKYRCFFLIVSYYGFEPFFAMFMKIGLLKSQWTIVFF